MSSQSTIATYLLAGLAAALEAVPPEFQTRAVAEVRQTSQPASVRGMINHTVLREPWSMTEVDRLPATHRIRLADIDGTSQKFLVWA